MNNILKSIVSGEETNGCSFVCLSDVSVAILVILFLSFSFLYFPPFFFLRGWRWRVARMYSVHALLGHLPGCA